MILIEQVVNLKLKWLVYHSTHHELRRANRKWALYEWMRRSNALVIKKISSRNGQSPRGWTERQFGRWKAKHCRFIGTKRNPSSLSISVRLNWQQQVLTMWYEYDHFLYPFRRFGAFNSMLNRIPVSNTYHPWVGTLAVSMLWDGTVEATFWPVGVMVNDCPTIYSMLSDGAVCLWKKSDNQSSVRPSFGEEDDFQKELWIMVHMFR